MSYFDSLYSIFLIWKKKDIISDTQYSSNQFNITCFNPGLKYSLSIYVPRIVY